MHRLAYADAHGPIPDGMLIRHKCDNPACFNVNHLELGTQRDNMQDASKRGRINKTK
ncbi:HNH endonuclease signature motif containing protein, partial [Pseudomonas aeruginosa]|uniref:HNH endonuclease signature motif containing protein n=1 Tax=Pseudomonas aeruginosa TaxID=287 RepID=UPI003D159BE4